MARTGLARATGPAPRTSEQHPTALTANVANDALGRTLAGAVLDRVAVVSGEGTPGGGLLQRMLRGAVAVAEPIVVPEMPPPAPEEEVLAPPPAPEEEVLAPPPAPEEEVPPPPPAPVTLVDDVVRGRFVAGVAEIESHLAADARVGDFVRQTTVLTSEILTSVGVVPPRFHVEATADDYHGSFHAPTWTLDLNVRKMMDCGLHTLVDELGIEAVRDLANTLYHESTHCQQAFRAIQFLALEDREASAETLLARLEYESAAQPAVARAAQLARAEGLTPELRAYGRLMLGSFVEMAAYNQAIVELASLTSEITQGLRGMVGQPREARLVALMPPRRRAYRAVALKLSAARTTLTEPNRLHAGLVLAALRTFLGNVTFATFSQLRDATQAAERAKPHEAEAYLAGDQAAAAYEPPEAPDDDDD